jgi:hypothetical protein
MNKVLLREEEAADKGITYVKRDKKLNRGK